MFTYHPWDSVEFTPISKDEFVKWVQKVQIWNTSTSLRGQWDNMGLLIPGLSVVKCNTGRVNYNTEVLIIELNQIILFYHKTLLIHHRRFSSKKRNLPSNSPSPSYKQYFRNTWCMVTSSNGNIFRVTGPLCGEFTGHRWIPRTKPGDAELWCFLWSASE